MLEVVLCDDDESVIAYCSTFLEKTAQKHGLSMRLRSFHSAVTCLFELDSAVCDVDIFFLDVQMPAMSGLDLAKKLRELGSGAQIVFLSNEPGFVFESFEVQPLYYLVKGKSDSQKFEQVFLRAAQLAKKHKTQTVLFERGSERCSIALDEIVYFEVIKRVVTVHYGKDQTFSFYAKLEDLAASYAGKGFIRIHRAFLVNAAHIRRLAPETIELVGGHSLPLGRTYAKHVRESLSSFLSSGEII